MMAAEDLNVHSMPLSVLLEGIADVATTDDRRVTGLAMDSRAVHPGDVFLACAGFRHHAVQFAEQAVAEGAVAVIYESMDDLVPAPGYLSVPAVAVPALTTQLGLIADRFYGAPSADMTVIGITGTNGKTSCSQFLAQALDTPGQPCGVIGTLGYGLAGALKNPTHTTPDAVTLHALLAGMRDQGARHAVIEASSHGLQQGRLNAVRFAIGVWTNLTRDHLDYHGDMTRYAQAKERLFSMPGPGEAVFNLDDAAGRDMARRYTGHLPVTGYGLHDEAGEYPVTDRQLFGRDLHLDMHGISMQVCGSWGTGHLHAPLLGEFNASNLLAVLAVLLLRGIALDDALLRLSRVRTVPGRMERFGGIDGKPLVVVDYAHTPDAMRQVLEALRGHCRGKLWCVFGCGGDRDAGKRPLMGAAAEDYADHLVITDDNPRFEDPIQIIADILEGLENPDAAYVQRDRRAAIALAVQLSRPGDIVLVAGKGHEDYQEINGQRIPFSDRDTVRLLLGEVQA